MDNLDLYYIGFNSNNAIANNFKGTITLYPTLESGNMFFSDHYLEDTSSSLFLEKYRNFIIEQYNKIMLNNSNSKFMCFNKKIIDICNTIDGMKFVKTNSSELIDKLNDKNEIRKIVSCIVPILDYNWYSEKKDYNEIVKEVGTSSFVLQGKTGAGGETTFLINNKEEYDRLCTANDLYCVSNYLKNVPLNVTCIIFDNDTICFQPSAQLIEISDNKFKYVGGDFVYPLTLDSQILEDLKQKSLEICSIINKIGYRGIMGIDYVLDKNNNLYFMEVNPRFQSSTFLINNALRDVGSDTVSHLHYKALNNECVKNLKISPINSSFLNCNLTRNYPEFTEDYICNYGYFEPNQKSIYRKVINRSIINSGNFERI